MKISNRSQQTLAVLMELARLPKGARLPIVALNERLGTSVSYLESLMRPLREQHFVASVRGPGGGYQLACPANLIRVADVLLATGELQDEGNDSSDRVLEDTAPLAWQTYLTGFQASLTERFMEILSATSVADLVEIAQPVLCSPYRVATDTPKKDADDTEGKTVRHTMFHRVPQHLSGAETHARVANSVFDLGRLVGA